MNPGAYWYILVASLAGGFAGVLVMWNRKRSQIAGEHKLRQFAVLTLGTAASACALIAFTKVFGDQPQIYAVMVMILMTGWAAVCQRRRERDAKAAVGNGSGPLRRRSHQRRSRMVYAGLWFYRLPGLGKREEGRRVPGEFSEENGHEVDPFLTARFVSIRLRRWQAVLCSVVQLPVPRYVLKVRTGELAVLRSSWTGVRLFGTFLRSTPLRHLGGRVYLSDVGQDPLTVLRGIHDAEAVHILALLFCCPWLVVWGVQGRWLAIVWGLAVHVPLNVYPILHLRYVTWRLEGYQARMRRSEGA